MSMDDFEKMIKMESSEKIAMEVLRLASGGSLYEATEMLAAFDSVIDREYKEAKERASSLASFIGSRK